MREGNHISDAQIQQYALNEAGVDPATGEHIAQCAQCSGRVVWYQKIAGSIPATAGPVFDFELAQAVLVKLPSPKRRRSTTLVFTGCTAICGIAAGLYAFYYLSALLMNGMAEDLAAIVYTAVAACGVIFTFLVADLSWEHIAGVRRLAATGSLQQNPGRAV